MVNGLALLLAKVNLVNATTLNQAVVLGGMLNTEQTVQFAKVFDFAMRAHAGQTRLNGEPFINHPLRVALTTLELLKKARKNVTTDVKAGELVTLPALFRNEMRALHAAILHDVAEDTPYTLTNIANLFGIEVTEWVRLLTKLKPDADFTPAGKQAMLKDYFAAIAKAPFEVRIIKIADRIDNLSGMETWSAEKQQDYVCETLDYIAPIAIATDNNAADWLSRVVLDVQARIDKVLTPKVK